MVAGSDTAQVNRLLGIANRHPALLSIKVRCVLPTWLQVGPWCKVTIEVFFFWSRPHLPLRCVHYCTHDFVSLGVGILGTVLCCWQSMQGRVHLLPALLQKYYVQQFKVWSTFSVITVLVCIFVRV